MKFFLLFLFGIWSLFLTGGRNHPLPEVPSFRNPLDIPLQLSSNFGEVRSDHFHTGYDIRTNGKTGYKVYAAADGYVSRIKVASGGFGKALYLVHPGGYMTVYGHLDGFNTSLASYVKEQQYLKKSFEVELFPDASRFPFKKGDWIALSGNSGSSGGPHLHFEIRDASGESYPLNPYPFIPYPDQTPPKITAFHVYPAEACCGRIPPKPYALSGTGNLMKLKADSLVVNERIIGFGIETEDFMDNSSSDLGIYRLELILDGKPVYNMELNRLVFANNRFLNAHIDYAEMKRTGKIIRRLFRLPGDRNTVYENVYQNGLLSFTDTNWHTARIQVYDVAGNRTQLDFRVRYSGREMPVRPPETGTRFRYNESNSFRADSVRIDMPADVLYEDVLLVYKTGQTGTPGSYSALHRIHNSYTPLHGYYDLSLLPGNMPQELRSKAVIVCVDEDGKRSARSCSWNEGWLTARVRDFGDYYITADTIAPEISPLGIKQNQTITRNEIPFTVADNLSGIASYEAKLDGKWLLMEYDPKNKRMTCLLEDTLRTGAHQIVVTAADQVGNKDSFKLMFKKQ